MAKTEPRASQSSIWVPIIGSGTDDDPFRPDVPDDVSWQAEIPSNLDPASRDYGKPAVKHARVSVASRPAGPSPVDSSVPLCGTAGLHGIKSAVPADKVADEDRLLVEMCRLVSDRSDWSDIVAVFLREKARGQNAPGRAVLGRLLVHMTRRGLPEASARAIAQQVGML